MCASCVVNRAVGICSCGAAKDDACTHPIFGDGQGVLVGRFVFQRDPSYRKKAGRRDAGCSNITSRILKPK